MAEYVKLYEENPSEKVLTKIAKVLKNGGLVIYPTDTVYGLGCDINNNKALEKVARLRGVKLEKANFSFICHDLSNLSEYVAQIPANTFKILKRNLPGAYTFNSIARAIVEKLGNPIISTSIRDEDDLIEYTTDPELIFEKWQKHVDLVIDGGYGDNTASTVIDLTQNEPVLIREGKGAIEI